MVESAVERLVKTHPDLETWWDSSPLVYHQWSQKMINAVDTSHRSRLEEQLGRLDNQADPAQSLFRGCTTNPSLSLQAVLSSIPAQVMEKLLKIPFCFQAYDPNGLELEQFNDHPSTVSTVEAFSKGFAGLEGFIHDRMTVHH
jgi:hypothetical protein